jgi:hypothetical protein
MRFSDSFRQPVAFAHWSFWTRVIRKTPLPEFAETKDIAFHRFEMLKTKMFSNSYRPQISFLISILDFSILAFFGE